MPLESETDADRLPHEYIHEWGADAKGPEGLEAAWANDGTGNKNGPLYTRPAQYNQVWTMKVT